MALSGGELSMCCSVVRAAGKPHHTMPHSLHSLHMGYIDLSQEHSSRLFISWDRWRWMVCQYQFQDQQSVNYIIRFIMHQPENDMGNDMQYFIELNQHQDVLDSVLLSHSILLCLRVSYLLSMVFLRNSKARFLRIHLSMNTMCLYISDVIVGCCTIWYMEQEPGVCILSRCSAVDTLG